MNNIESKFMVSVINQMDKHFDWFPIETISVRMSDWDVEVEISDWTGESICVNWEFDGWQELRDWMNDGRRNWRAIKKALGDALEALEVAPVGEPTPEPETQAESFEERMRRLCEELRARTIQWTYFNPTETHWMLQNEMDLYFDAMRWYAEERDAEATRRFDEARDAFERAFAQMQSYTPSRTRLLELLGLQRGATDQQVKQAYRTFMRAHHPDLAGDDPENLALVQEVNSLYDAQR